jgi:integrase
MVSTVGFAIFTIVATGPTEFFTGMGVAIPLLKVMMLPPRQAGRRRAQYAACIQVRYGGQRREEVAQMVGDEIDFNSRTWTLPGSRTKNGKPHIVHLSEACIKLIKRASRSGSYVFSISGARPFQNFTNAKRVLDELSGAANLCLRDGPTWRAASRG